MTIKDSNVARYRFSVGLLHPSNWLTWLGVAVFFVLAFYPMVVIDWLGCRLGNVLARKNKKRFNIARTNIRLCFPDKNDDEVDAMVYEHFRYQFRSLLHYAVLWWRPGFMVRRVIEKTGFEQIQKYQRQGKNIILLLTHNVGLDFAVTGISMDSVANGPYKELRNPVMNWLMANGRLRFSKKFGSKLFTREDGLKPLIRETRAGKVLIYLADEDLGAKGSLFVPFFGVQKATLPVLGRLAKTCDAVVLPCVSCYLEEQRRYRVSLLPKIEGLPSGDDEVDAIKMNQAIEDAINRCPVQYLWTLRYFQTRPEGEASVYE